MNPFKKLFQPRYDLTSYTPSLIRLALGTLVVVLSIALRKYCVFRLEILNALCATLLILIGLCGTAQIYMVICEISFISDNRASKKLHALTAEEIRNLPHKRYPVEEIMEMIDREPLLELFIISRDRLLCITIGSDSREIRTGLFTARDEYFNKTYSIENEDFTSIEEFRAALLAHADNGFLSVHDIDGVTQK